MFLCFVELIIGVGVWDGWAVGVSVSGRFKRSVVVVDNPAYAYVDVVVVEAS